MPINVLIPVQLRKLTDNKDIVTVNAMTIEEMITGLEKCYRGIKDRMINQSGEIVRFINVYVNGEDIRFLANQKTPLKDGDEVSIVAAVAGG